MKHIKTNRLLSIAIITCMLITGTPLQAIAKEINEDKQWQDIITTFEGDQNKNSLENIAPTSGAVQNNTDESEQDEKQFSLEAANEEFKTDRFIIKYSDNIQINSIVNIPDLATDTEGQKTLEEISKSIDLNSNENSQNNSLQLSEIQESVPVEIDSAQLQLPKTTIDTASVVESENIMLLKTKQEMTGEEFKEVLNNKDIGQDVEYIQPDYELTMFSADPYFEEQWGHYQMYQPVLDKDGLESEENSTAKPYRMDSNVLDAWEKTKGAGAIVALLDTGIETTHVDLQDNLLTGWDFVNNDDSVNDINWKYDQWHGTHIAGIIAAEADNNVGIAGVAPEAKILPLKVFQSGMAYTSDIIAAIKYAELCGAKIANCSWGTKYDNPALKAAIESSSMVFVCAAGNGLYDTDKYPVYPASYDLINVISVTSIDQDGKLSRFANYGKESVDIAAPGRDIYSTTIDNGFVKNSGTSMSAGFVSGALALLLSNEHTKSASELKSRIISSGDRITGLTDKVKGGKKLNCGYALSINPLPNLSTIIVDDDEQLPDINPNGDTGNSNKEYAQYAENSISIKTPMPTARHGLGVVAVGNKIYAIGGQLDSGYSNKVEEYDPKTDTWTTKANMPAASSYFGIAKIDDQIYVIGGFNGSYLNSVQVYTPATNTWTTMPSTHNMPVAMKSFAATAYNGKIYVTGGYNGAYRNTVYEYNPTTGAWIQKQSLLNNRGEHVSVEYGGKIYIDGGCTTNGNWFNVEEVYDPETNQVTQTGASRIFTINGAALNIGERYILIGGKDTGTSKYDNAITHRSLNFSDNSVFQVVNSMYYSRAGLGITEAGGKVYIIGGQNSSGVLSVVEELDLGWEVKGNLPQEIKNFTSIECNGKLYLFGGEALSGGVNVKIKKVYEYAPETNTWTQKADMPDYRQGFAVAVAYGKVYMIGGNAASTSNGGMTADNKVYVFDPVKNSWTEKMGMSSARYYLSATNFNDMIYIAGGSGTSGNNVEVFDPLKETWQSKSPLPQACNGYFLTVSNNKLLLVGSNVLEYNASSDTWSTKYSNLNWSNYLDSNSLVNLYGNIFNLNNIKYINKTPFFYKYDPAANVSAFYPSFYLFNKAFNVITLNNKVYTFDGSGSYAQQMIEYRPPVAPWLQQNNNGTASYEMGMCSIGNDIYHIGGFVDGGQDSIVTSGAMRLNTQTNSWTSISPMNYVRADLAVGVCNGKIYATGGRNADTATSVVSYLEEYNPATNTWNNKTSMPRVQRNMACASYNGKIYIFGGTNGSSTYNTTYIYDPSTNTWTTGASMPTARYGCNASVLSDGKIYVVGGADGGNAALRKVEAYDPVNNSWSTKQDMPGAWAFSGVIGRDSLYVIGGTNFSMDNGLVYEYSPVTNKWFTWQGPGLALHGMGVAIANNGIYVINGTDIINTYYNLVKYLPLGSYNADYIHLGEESVNLSGNLARNYTDMRYTSQGFQINFSRTYNSRDDRTEGNIISKGWTFGFQGKISSAGNDTLARLPNGSGFMFKENIDGTFVAKDSRSTLIKQSDKSYVLTTKDLYSYGFNKDGYLTWMKDRNGNTVSITVDSTGKITQISDPVGRQTNITYSSNRIWKITDFSGRIVQYSYDASGNLSTVTDPMGNITKYSYDSKGFLAGVKDQNDNLIESFTYYDIPSYETLPKLKTATDALGKTDTYQYDEGEGTTTVTDNKGRQNITWFDKMLYPVRIKDVEGKEQHIEYNLTDGVNKYGEERVVVDRRGNATYYDRDLRGNVIRQINPDGSIKEFTYDNKDNKISEKDELGKQTFYLYDSNKINLLKKVQPLNGTDVYMENGSQDNFAITTNSYYTDSEAQTMCGKVIKGLLKSVTDPRGYVTSYTYDSYANIVTTKNALNQTATSQYNPIGWLKQETDVKGYTTKYYYDRNGNMIKKVDHGGETERWVFNYRGKITQNVKPNQYLAASDTASAFDSNNILTNTNTYGTAAHGYRYVYFSNGQLQKETDPLNYETNYTYDQYGNVLSKTQANGFAKISTYDVLNRIKSEAYQNSSVSAITVTDEYSYSLTSNGNFEKIKKHYFNSAYCPETASSKETYDFDDQLIRTDNADGGYSTNEYAANGTLVLSINPMGNKTYYTYDGLNRQIGKWSSVANGVCEYEGTEYDKSNNLTKKITSKNIVSPNKIPTIGIKSSTFVYDAIGRIVEQGDSMGGKTILAYDDSLDKVTQRQYTSAAEFVETENQYNYLDKIKETSLKVNSSDLLNSESVIKTSYTFDKDGNVLAETRPNDVIITYTYDLMGRRLTSTEQGIDENGQVTTTLTNTYTYDFRGNVLTEKDPLNRITKYTYTAAGLLQKTIDPKNGVLYTERTPDDLIVAEINPKNYIEGLEIGQMTRKTYQYDAMRRVISEKNIYKDVSGAFQTITKEYTYDKNGNQLTAKDGKGYITRFTYDGRDRQLTMLDPENYEKGLAFTTKYTYDGLGQTISQENGVHAVTSYTYNDQGKLLTTSVNGTLVKSNIYDLAGNLLSEGDGNGNTTTYKYNALGKVRSATLPGDSSIAVHTTNNLYNAAGDLVKTVDSAGKVNTYNYDKQHNMISETEMKDDKTGAITKSYGYDLEHNLIFSVDGRGNTTEFTYDALNQKLTQKVSVTVNGTLTTQTTSYEYDEDGKLTRITDWLGNKYVNIYDSLDRLISRKDPLGSAIEILSYDDNLRQIGSTDALNNVITFTYDKAGRNIAKTDASGNIERKTYDAAGNMVSSTDGNGNVINYQYDEQNRLISVKNPLQEETSYTYDEAGNLLAQTDGNGNTVSYKYNARNLPVLRIDAGGVTSDGAIKTDRSEIYSYYSGGKISKKIDANRNVTGYDYDIHGRLLRENAGGESVSYTYDNNNNQLTMVDRTGTTARVYDELGRVTRKTVPVIGTTKYFYDQTAELSSGYVNETSIDPKGDITVKTKDKAGRLCRIKSGGNVTNYTYYANGNLQKLAYPNGATEEYTYYANNKLNTLVNKQGSSTLEAFSYCYDGAGNMIGKADRKGTTTYTYDSLNRLKSVSEPEGRTTAYEFDHAGNRTSETVTEGTVITKTGYTYNEQNRLMRTTKLVNSEKRGGTEYSFDNNGNILSERPYTLTSAAISESALKINLSVLGTEGTQNDAGAIYEYDARNQMIKTVSGKNTVESKYNGDGRRVSKTINGATSNYLYEYDKIILETDGSNALVAQNIYGTNLISRSIGNDNLYYMYNGHGDVTSLQASDGTSKAQYYYDAFGTATEVIGDVNNPFRYAGYEFDEETELYYLKSRMYDSVNARFMQEDTYRGEASDPLSLNLYTYCVNNPILYTDPTGHWKQGDEKLSLSAQKKIKQLTDAYFSASTPDQKKAIAEQADSIRNNKSNQSNNKADNFASAANNAIKTSGNIDSKGNNYITAATWQNISVDNERRSGGQMTVKSTNTVKDIMSVVNTNAKYSDYKIGSSGYLGEVNIISKTNGSKAAIDYIIADEKAHSKELDTIKNNYFLKNDPKFKNFYTTVNSLVTKYGTVTEDIHYFRNRLNWAPSSLDALLTMNAATSEGKDWRLMTPMTAMYHMNGNGGIFNLKFVSADGHFEAVYNMRGNLVTDPINMGTYNYVDPKNTDGHKAYDVDPYCEYGNTNPSQGGDFAKLTWEAKNNYLRWMGNDEAMAHWWDAYKEANPEAYNREFKSGSQLNRPYHK